MADAPTSKRSNPNILEVFEEEDEDGDNHRHHNNNVHAVPGYEFDNIRPTTTTATAATTTPGKKTRHMDTDKGKEEEYDYGYQQQQQHAGVQVFPDFNQGTSDVFLYDYTHNGPMESFRFGDLQRALASRALATFNPIIMFVADVAVKTGTSVENMLINPELPLVKTDATSVRELFDGSKTPMDILMPILMIVLMETLHNHGNAAATTTATKAVSPADTVKRVLSFPESPYKQTQFLIGELQQHRDALASHGPELIGVLPGAAAAPAGANPQTNVLDELLAALRRYNPTASATDEQWNMSPAHTGIALIKPEVVASIETAYEDIRRISAAHREFKLWHLITSPSVRHNFAAMISGMLNSAPSEIQYPHYQKSVRNNGAVTGSRVSSGLWTQARGSALYKEKLRWFHSVHYGTSTKWRETENRFPLAKQTVDAVRSSLVTSLLQFKNSIITDTTAVWKQLVFCCCRRRRRRLFCSFCLWYVGSQ